MKKAIFVMCFALILTACSSTNDNSDTRKEVHDSSKISQVNKEANDSELKSNPFLDENDEGRKIPQVSQKLSDDEIEKLGQNKCGYGQGKRVDDNNRPYGALDFNNEFGKYDSFAIEDTDEKIVYITFDQGYENGYTSVILDTLKEKNVKATFFVLTDYVEKNPELIKRMIDEGHTIGNHSVNHYSMPTLDINTAKTEINELHQYMIDKYDYEMFLFRPPMGEFSEKSLATTQACGYKTVMWSYAYADWDVNQQMENSKALKKVTEAAHPGAIYLLHSVSKTNAEILGEMIDNLVADGYNFSIPQ